MLNDWTTELDPWAAGSIRKLFIFGDLPVDIVGFELLLRIRWNILAVVPEKDKAVFCRGAQFFPNCEILRAVVSPGLWHHDLFPASVGSSALEQTPFACNRLGRLLRRGDFDGGRRFDLGWLYRCSDSKSVDNCERCYQKQLLHFTLFGLSQSVHRELPGRRYNDGGDKQHRSATCGWKHPVAVLTPPLTSTGPERL